MKRFALLLFLAGPVLAFAQDKAAAPKEPTVAELKLQIAQRDVDIANLKLQLVNAQATIQLLQSPQYQSAAVQAQQELAAAQHAVRAAALPESKK